MNIRIINHALKLNEILMDEFDDSGITIIIHSVNEHLETW